MKKLIPLLLALVLVLGLVMSTGAADAVSQEDAAWELYRLGLFKGTGTDEQGFPVFSLDTAPTRVQGVTMLVRLIGGEDKAQKTPWTAPFQDVPDWAKPYVGYAYANGLTNGRSATRFDPNATITATEYLTFVLRSLGYASGEDFAWDSAWTLSDKLGVTDGEYSKQTNRDFVRGDVAQISARALDCAMKDSKTALRDILAEQGVRDMTSRCRFEETCRTCRENVIFFSFAPTADSPASYEKFVVNSATVNGVPCTVTQYTTPKAVADYCKGLTNCTMPEAFALTGLRYDQSKALANAAESITAGGETYPVLSFKLNCTGTLKDGTKAEELFIMDYYIDGYWGPLTLK